MGQIVEDDADDSEALLRAPSTSPLASFPGSKPIHDVDDNDVHISSLVPIHKTACGMISLLINFALLVCIIFRSSTIYPGDSQVEDVLDEIGGKDNDKGPKDTIRFFGMNYTANVWRKRQEYINDIFGSGKWMNAWDTPNYSLPFTDPCVQITHYKNGKCMDSNPSQGRRLMWKPLNGSIHAFSAETMCSMIDGKNVLVVGDSLNEEFFFSFLSAMWAQIIRPKKDSRQASFWEKFRSDLDNRCQNFCLDPFPACDGPETVYCGEHSNFTLGFSRDDYLIHLVPSVENKSRMMESNWVQQVRKQNISLLIINTGAHYMEIHEEKRNLMNSLSYLYKNFPYLSIMYRTSIAGHENCEQHFHSEPLSELPHIYTQHPEWHWGDIGVRNLDIIDMISQHFPRVLRFDVFNATSLRADSHPGSGNDCLHYCIPGVTDDWVTFFYNALLIITNNVHLTKEEGSHEEIPTRKFNRFDLNGKLIKNYAADTVYRVLDGKRHVYINGTGPGGNKNVISVRDEDFFHIPAGVPIS